MTQTKLLQLQRKTPANRYMMLDSHSLTAYSILFYLLRMHRLWEMSSVLEVFMEGSCKKFEYIFLQHSCYSLRHDFWWAVTSCGVSDNSEIWAHMSFRPVLYAVSLFLEAGHTWNKLKESSIHTSPFKCLSRSSKKRLCNICHFSSGLLVLCKVASIKCTYAGTFKNFFSIRETFTFCETVWTPHNSQAFKHIWYLCLNGPAASWEDIHSVAYFPEISPLRELSPFRLSLTMGSCSSDWYRLMH